MPVTADQPRERKGDAVICVALFASGSVRAAAYMLNTVHYVPPRPRQMPEFRERGHGLPFIVRI
jgi:hypothetical protein